MKKKLHALFLALAMVLALGSPASAAEVPTIGTGTEPWDACAVVTKELVLAEGISVPCVTFQFELTPVTSDAPEATIAPITYPARDSSDYTQDETGLIRITQSSPIVFAPFTHAGLYEYTLKEIANTYSGEGTMAYSEDVYTLRVYVANKYDGSVYIQTITAEKDFVKQSEIRFTNIFSKPAQLEISKETVGDLANKQHSFDFVIKFNAPATSCETEFIGHTDGPDGVEVRCPVGQEVAFTLYDGQKLNFDDLPAGTRYVVTELAAKDGYIPSVTVTENGQVFQTKYATMDDEAMTSLSPDATDNLVGEEDNKAAFVNIYQDIPITGVDTNELPFFLLIAAAAAAFTLLLVLKRRDSVHRE